MIFFTILNPSSRPVFLDDFLAIYKAWNEVGEKTTFLTITCGGNFLTKKKRSIRVLAKKKKNKERTSYLVHETGKKVFFSNTHGFAEVPLDTIFNVFSSMVPSERFSLGSSKLAGATKKKSRVKPWSPKEFFSMFFFS